MAFKKWSYALRGSLAGLVAVATSTATFGAEAEGVVRIRSADPKPAGIVIRGQSPNDCVPLAPVLSGVKTQGAAPVASLIVPKEPLAPEPRVTTIAGEEAGAAGESIEAPATLPSTAELTGEYAGLFSSESAAPFDKPFDFAEAVPAGTAMVGSESDGGIAQMGHRRAARKKCRHGHEAGHCPEGCPPEIAYSAQSCPSAVSNCPPVYYDECPPGHHCRTRHVLGNNCIADKLRCHSINHRLRTRQCSDSLSRMFHNECDEKFNWFRCKFGYFFPSGSGGKGSALVGHYSMVYPVNPQYQDPRDCQVYAAQGYYGPVAVPLAPVVHHTYNYGWGVPSSRLTPVSHPVAAPYPPLPY